MPSINFTMFTDKILSGEKCQTIRLPRKREIKPGDKIKLCAGMYTNNYKVLGEVVCSEVNIIWIYIDCKQVFTIEKLVNIPRRLSFEQVKQLAKEDGFENIPEFSKFFKKHYGIHKKCKEFHIIKWRDFVPAGEG